jgi:hypothetical protein
MIERTTVHLEVQFPDDTLAMRGIEGLPELFQGSALFAGATIGGVEVDLQQNEQPPTKFEKSLPLGADLFTADVQRRLDTPLEDLIDAKDGLAKGHRTRIKNALGNQGMYTSRDVLAGGWYALTCGEIGAKAAYLVVDAAKDHVPEVPAVHSPLPSDAALFCESLDQLSHGVVEVSAQSRVYGVGRVSIAEIIQPYEGEDYQRPVLARFDETRGLFRRYAQQFSQAQRRPLRLF